MEVTKDEQRKLDDLFRKIADRDEFVAQQRQAAETLRRKEAEPPVTVWAVVDHYTLRDWGQEGFAIRGVYLTLDEAVAHIHAERESHKTEGPLMPIEGKGENTRWDYTDWDTAHSYGIEQAPILSTFKTEGQPLPEDSVIFQKGVAEGRRLERLEQKPADVASRELRQVVGSLRRDVDLVMEIGAASRRYPEVSFAKLSRIAKRFFELGQKDAANKFDEIEYNRQREEEEMTRDKRKCRWNDGAFCNKGLPGTPCDVYTCVAYMEKEDEK